MMREKETFTAGMRALLYRLGFSWGIASSLAESLWLEADSLMEILEASGQIPGPGHEVWASLQGLNDLVRDLQDLGIEEESTHLQRMAMALNAELGDLQEELAKLPSGVDKGRGDG